MIDDAGRRTLLTLARSAIALELCTPPPPATGAHPVLHERRGAFVTLTLARHLRGCMGRTEPDAPLADLLRDVAVTAATRDPRFAPLTREELIRVVIEVSVLSPPVKVGVIDEIEVGTHGLVVNAHGRRGLLLPQVATQWGWTREEFVAETCRKAGLSADAWQRPGTVLCTFTAEVFGEDG